MWEFYCQECQKYGSMWGLRFFIQLKHYPLWYPGPLALVNLTVPSPG